MQDQTSAGSIHDFTGKVVLVTGAAKASGEELSSTLPELAHRSSLPTSMRRTQQRSRRDCKRKEDT